MPLSYEKSMSDTQRILAMATLLYRKDTKSFEKVREDIGMYVPMAQRIFEKNRPLIFSYLELLVTTKCSLRCKHCANFMQHYTKEKHITYDLETLKENLHRALLSIDYIEWFRILGGEPLLYKNIAEITEYCLSLPQLGRVQIVTNGTILPSRELLAVMSNNPRASFDLSNYGPISKRMDEIITMLQQHNVNYSLQESYIWEDMGGTTPHNYSISEQKAVYASCDNICKTLVGTEIHICPRSANGMILDIIPRKLEDYVDIRAQSPQETKQKLWELFQKEYIEACQVCNALNKRSPIPAGEQL